MKKALLNMYNLHKKILVWERYERQKTIHKYLKKSQYNTINAKLALNVKHWDKSKQRSISIQTNVCRREGGFKRTLNLVGFNRHMLRQHLNVGALPNLKKLHW